MPLLAVTREKILKRFPSQRSFCYIYSPKQAPSPPVSLKTVPRATRGRPSPPGLLLPPPLRAPTLSAVLGAGFSFPLAINIALIFAATAAAASRAPEGAAELSEPATAELPSPPPGKGRPGSGAVPGRRKAAAGPGWSHLLRRLRKREASAPAALQAAAPRELQDLPRLATAAAKPFPAAARGPAARTHPPAAPASRCAPPPADMAPAWLHRLRAGRSVISGRRAAATRLFRPPPPGARGTAGGGAGNRKRPGEEDRHGPRGGA